MMRTVASWFTEGCWYVSVRDGHLTVTAPHPSLIIATLTAEDAVRKWQSGVDPLPLVYRSLT